MKPLLRRGLVLPAVAALVLLVHATSLAAEPLSIEADTLEFSTDGRSIRADGQVTLTYQNIILRAESVVCEGNIVSAAGQVELTSDRGHLFADRLKLDLSTRGLSATSVHGRLAGLNVKADSMDSRLQGEESLRRATITRCDLAVPCYELRAGRITVSGRKITIERGWLVLKGLTLLPLPRITLDLDRAEDWPLLSAGLGPHGLVLGAELTLPMSAASDLVLKGEAATGGLLSLRPSFVWRPSTTITVAPWVSYSTLDGSTAGLDAALVAGGSTIDLGMYKDWRRDLLSSKLSATMPLRDLAAGHLVLQWFWNQSRSPVEGNLAEAGAALRWFEQGPGGNSSLVLALGQAWRDGHPFPLVRIEAEVVARINSDWGWETEIGYDVAGGVWRDGKIGITRYLHCYFFRLGYDWIESSMDLNVGISF